MVISKNYKESIIMGKVVCKKKGSGSAADILTIITISDLHNGKQIKVLCWNSKFNTGYQFSDKARNLREGDIISAKVVFDIGDEKKCVCKEMKKSGLYTLRSEDMTSYVLCGQVAKVMVRDNLTIVMIPTFVYRNGIQKVWYRVNFWNSSSSKAAYIHTGSYICIRCSQLQDIDYNGFRYKALSGTYYET